MPQQIQPVETQPFWLPRLTGKQLEIFNSYKRYLLCSGPRRSGKTFGVLHKLVRHAYDYPKAKILIVAKTLGIAKDGGVWTDLVDTVLPEWFDAGITSYAIEPKQDGQTRTLFLGLRSRYNTISKIYLAALDHDQDAERKFRGRRFSLVFFNELSNFRSRIVFNAAKEMLRIPGMKHEHMQMLFDTNPSDEGTRSWIYKLWWGERLAVDCPDTCTTDDAKAEYRQFQNELGVLEVMIPDNDYLSLEERQSLIASYRSNPDEMDRYIYGKWTEASSEGFFSKVFLDDVHIIGDNKSLNPEDWEGILPDENTSEIFIGWDIGDLNPSAVFLVKKRDSSGRNFWSIIDELVVTDEEVGMEDFVHSILKKMEKWERFLGHPVLFRHWSDNSSMRYKIAASASEHIMVTRYSHGVIRLEAADKYAHAAMDAVDMFKRLFYEGRLFVSATCPNTIKMFRALRPKFSRDGGVASVAKVAPHVHVFDSARYAVMAEEPLDLRRNSIPRSGQVKARIVAMA